MNRQEFIDSLRAALNGRISPVQVEDNINYYQDYINVETRKGRSEEEVLAALGNPRLIARTIVQTSGQDTAGSRGAEPGSDYREAREARESRRDIRRTVQLPRWLLTIIVILVLMLVLSVVFSVLSFLAPVLLVMAAVLFMVKLFRDWLN